MRAQRCSAEIRKQKLVVVSVLLLGLMFSSAAFAFAVYGAIGDKYTKLGRERGPLGAPLSDEADAPHGGRFNNFQGGFIYWHPRIGAFAVWGLIGEKWNAAGRVAYGYPITDELGTPDGRGRFNHFRAMHMAGNPEASIYWTPQTGAHLIYGAIRGKWASMGWERSALGYPTSDEFQDGNYRRSNFERGFIRWSPARGAEVFTGTTASPEPRPNSFGGLLVSGIDLIADAPGGRTIPIYSNNTFLTGAGLCAALMSHPQFNNLGETIKTILVAQIRKSLPGGFGVHSQTNNQITKNCSGRAELVGSRISVNVRLPGNRFFVRITTPRGFPGSLDPNFFTHYDLSATATIEIPESASSGLTLGPAQVIASNIQKPQTRSITGNVALAVNELISFFGGRDFTSEITKTRTISFDAIDLGSINGKLPANLRLESSYNSDRQTVVLHATGKPAQGTLIK